MQGPTLLEREKYRNILEAALEIEDDNWRLEDVQANGGHLSKLKSEGLVETVYSPANRANWYTLTDPERVESLLEDIDEVMESDG